MFKCLLTYWFCFEPVKFNSLTGSTLQHKSITDSTTHDITWSSFRQRLLNGGPKSRDLIGMSNFVYFMFFKTTSTSNFYLTDQRRTVSMLIILCQEGLCLNGRSVGSLSTYTPLNVIKNQKKSSWSYKKGCLLSNNPSRKDRELNGVNLDHFKYETKFNVDFLVFLLYNGCQTYLAFSDRMMKDWVWRHKKEKKKK